MQPNERAEALVRDFPEQAHFEEDGTLVIEDLTAIQRQVTENTLDVYGQIHDSQLAAARRKDAQAEAKRKAARKHAKSGRRNNR